MVKEYLIEKLLDAAFGSLSTYLREHTVTTSPQKQVNEAVLHHLNYVKKWCDALAYGDRGGSMTLSKVFVELDVYVYPRKWHHGDDGKVAKKSLSDVIDQHSRNIVLLGQPGAGKTSSLRHIARQVLERDDFIASVNFPILIELRALNSSSTDDADPLFRHIERLLGLSVAIPPIGPTIGDDVARLNSVRERVVTKVLQSLTPLLLIDGLDELRSSLRREVHEDLMTLTRQLEPGNLVLTSRTGEFNFELGETAEFEIAPLGDDQIRQVASRWLGTNATAFMAAIQRSPFGDTAMRPLTLSHLCAIYQREQSIPDRPKSVYRKIVTLLLEEWDQQRDVQRKSRFDSFTQDKKFDMLCELAYVLTVAGHTPRFSHAILMDAFVSISGGYGLSRSDSSSAVDEIESHTGLLLRAGSDVFEFPHKSMQEYLAAEYMVRLPSVPERDVLLRLPHETAVAVAISSNSSGYLAEVVLRGLLSGKMHPTFVDVFVLRLLSERPELRPNPEAALALALLYSEFRYQSSIRPMNKTIANLEELLLPLARAAGREGINRFYRRTGEVANHRLVVFARIADPQALRQWQFDGSGDALPLYCYLPAETASAIVDPVAPGGR